MSDPKNPGPLAGAGEKTQKAPQAKTDSKKAPPVGATSDAPDGPGAGSPRVKGETSGAQVVDVNAVLRELNALRGEFAELKRANTGAAVRQIGDGPSVKSESEIDTFLNAPKPEKPGDIGYGLYFAIHADRYAGILEHSKRTLNPETNQTETTVCIEIKSRRWTGPGSELFAENGQRLLHWGVMDVSSVPQVQAGTADFATMCARIEAWPDFQQGEVISFTRAQAYLKAKYEEMRFVQKSREALEGRLSEMPQGIEKSGILAAASA